MRCKGNVKMLSTNAQQDNRHNACTPPVRIPNRVDIYFPQVDALCKHPLNQPVSCVVRQLI